MIRTILLVILGVAVMVVFAVYLLLFLPLDWAIAVSLILTLLTVWRGVGWEG